jgi:5-methylcytosine-specific restriction endonuclease McrA
LLNQIIRKFGTKDSGQSHLKKFYEVVFSAIDERLSDLDILRRLTNHKDFTYLQPNESPYAGVSATRYSAQVKSGLVINELLPSAPRCSICNGLIPSQAISIDHKTRRADGGESGIENLQILHGYCNSGVKEAATGKARSV